MAKQFQTIGIVGTHGNPLVAESVSQTISLLDNHQYQPIVESETAKYLNSTQAQVTTIEKMGKICDLVVVVGGDGNFLNAAREFTDYDIPLLGINRGKLGFLTDIKPNELEQKLLSMLKGKYISESRFLITAQLHNCDESQNVQYKHGSNNILALNEIVISSGTFSKMLAFDVHINGDFVFSQRSDGLLISTPTGSTAYSLSGGGPILHPSLNVLTLVPMFPHTLTNRPIVINANHEVTVTLAENGDTLPILSHDGHTHCNVAPGDKITIKKHPKPLTLIHPEDYSYYHTLRTKLHWGKQLVSEDGIE